MARFKYSCPSCGYILSANFKDDLIIRIREHPCITGGGPHQIIWEKPKTKEEQAPIYDLTPLIGTPLYARVRTLPSTPEVLNQLNDIQWIPNDDGSEWAKGDVHFLETQIAKSARDRLVIGDHIYWVSGSGYIKRRPIERIRAKPREAGFRDVSS